jgi:hypothetical protein
MVPIHPVVLEKKFVLHISHRVGLLLFWLIENPRWLPTAGHILMYDPMGNMIKKKFQELLKGLLKPYKVLIKCCYFLF